MHAFSPSNKTNNLTTKSNQTNCLGLGSNSIFDDKFTSDVNELTSNQLNTVADMMKKIKGGKISEIIDNEYLNKK